MQKYFFIRTDGKFVRISYDDIVFMEAAKNYTKIITTARSYLVLLSLKKMEYLLPAVLFQRIHKSYIVALDKIMEFDKEMVSLKGKELPVGHQYRNELEKVFLILTETECKIENKNHHIGLQPLLNKQKAGRLIKAV